MRKWMAVATVIVLLLAVAGLGMMFIGQSRMRADKAGCANNLRMLSMLGMSFVNRDGRIAAAQDAVKPTGVWPGTVPTLAMPEDRLSWVVLALPSLQEPKLGDSWKSIDRDAKWDAPANKPVGEKVLRTLICPAYLPPIQAGEPAPTMYVGIAGLGADAATLPLTEPLSPRAGAFRYDSATPFATIIANDGVSQTFLFGQTNSDLGPWIRGGPSTVRGVLEDKPILARSGGQFGGTLSEGTYFAFVDGSVRLFRYETDPAILRSLATIAGGPISLD